MDPNVILGVLLCAVAGVGVTEWLMRRHVLAHVRQQMMTKAGVDALPAAPAPAEVPALGTPRLLRRAVGDEPQESFTVQLRWEARAVALLRRVLRTDLLYAAVYLAIPLAAGFAVMEGDPRIGVSMLGVMLAAPLAAFALVRFAVGLRRFDALDALLSPARSGPLWKRLLHWAAILLLGALGLLVAVGLVAVGVAVVPLWWVARRVLPWLTRPVTPRLQMLLSGLFVAAAAGLGLEYASGNVSLSERLTGAALVVAAAFHAGGLITQGRALRQMPGSALLVLRVFDRQRSTEFTFNRLIRYWRYFGHHFTVVDASLVMASGAHALGWHHRLALLLLFAGVGCASALAAGALGLPALAGAAPLVTAGAVILACLLIRALATRRIDGRFIRSREQLLDRLSRLDKRPRNLDMTYRHERAMCHDDTWFMAVGEFAQRADVVLMDLRGIAKTNKGCEKEIEFLFDTVPAERIVFLVDEQDPEAMAGMLAGCWREQQGGSPNVRTAEPELTLYVAGNKDLESLDLRALMRTLMLQADAALEARLSSAI